MYKIEVDLIKRILSNECSGFWDVTAAEKFFEDYKVAVGKISAAGPGWRVFADQKAMSIQSAEVVAIFSQIATYLQDMGPAKIAVLVPGTLGRLQIARTVTDERLKTFTSKEEACEWLDH